MKLKQKLLILSLLFGLLCQAQTRLRVGNSESWTSAQSTIEEAQFTIHPHGMYMEVGMYLTFSARGAKYDNGNTVIDFENSTLDLETQLRFQLPKGSMITDSWLWINDDIIQADIEERWHATQIYEEIVGFRLDPSLLTKDIAYWRKNDPENFYNLRVYPLRPDSTRRVKITYLTPGNWTNGTVSIPLPTAILKASKIPLEKVSIQCFLNNNFSKPRILQLPNKSFAPTTHTTLGNHLQSILSGGDIENGIDVSFDIPMENGVFLSDYEAGEIDHYQLVVLPQEALLNGAQSSRKILVLVDYDSTNTTFSKEKLFSTLKKQLIANLKPTDYFNLLLNTQNGLQLINSDWINADGPTIEIMFNLIEESYALAEVTNLPNLLESGMEFIQNKGNDGNMLLLACSEQFHEQEVADEFMATLTPKLSDAAFSIHIADYQNENQSADYYYGFMGEEMTYFENHYRGNEYFYTLFQPQIASSVHVIREQQSLENLLNQSLNAISPIQEITEVKISKEGGACFNHFKLPQSTFSSPTTNFLQVGKCVGDFPFTIEISGKVDGQTISKNITVNEPYINEGKEDHLISWVGNYIESLEVNRPYYDLTQRIVEEIIEWSLEYRVLSLYTAFLALEVELGGYLCEECIDETEPSHDLTNLPDNTENTSNNDIDLPSISFSQELRDGSVYTLPLGDSIITATKDLTLDTLIQFTANPNPFKEGVTITVSTQRKKAAELKGAIFDIDGQLVKRLTPITLEGGGQYQFYWDGTNTAQQRLNSGMYILSLQTDFNQISHKLILME